MPYNFAPLSLLLYPKAHVKRAFGFLLNNDSAGGIRRNKGGFMLWSWQGCRAPFSAFKLVRHPVESGQTKADGLTNGEAVQRDFLVAGRPGYNGRLPVQCHGKHKAVIIIRVVADEIHPPRSRGGPIRIFVVKFTKYVGGPKFPLLAQGFSFRFSFCLCCLGLSHESRLLSGP
jgi:hypothetical protein